MAMSTTSRIFSSPLREVRLLTRLMGSDVSRAESGSGAVALG